MEFVTKDVSEVLKDDSETTDDTTVFVASTETEDRHGDVIRQNWLLDEFNINGPILANHSPYMVVGQGTAKVVKKQLIVTVRWDLKSSDPSIRAIGEQHKSGIRKAGSVGFKPTKTVKRDQLPIDHFAYKPAEIREDDWGSYKFVGKFFDKPILREFSSVSIPANPDAMQRSYFEAMMAKDGGDIDARFKILAETIANATLAALLSDKTKAIASGILHPESEPTDIDYFLKHGRWPERSQ